MRICTHASVETVICQTIYLQAVGEELKQELKRAMGRANRRQTWSGQGRKPHSANPWP